jgi:tetratricopeptide (TPR) repeat protein
MKTDFLEELLARTDAALPPPSTSGLLTMRVAARIERRRRVHLALTALVTIGIAAAVLHSSQSHPRVVHPPSHEAAFDIAQCRREIAALDAEASTHQKAAEEIAAVQRKCENLENARAKALLAPDPLAHIEEARDRAARILLIDAVRLTAGNGRRAEAIEDYRKAIQLFPGTPAAREAAQRLKADGVSI